MNVSKSIFSNSHSNLVLRLIAARKDRGLTQVQVAKLLGRTQSYVSKIESGQRRIDIVQLEEFAKVYKKNANYFLKLK